METYVEGKIREQREALEKMIDAGSLAGVLENLEAVCHEKAEHLRTNWQDDGAARQWEYVARQISKAASAALCRLLRWPDVSGPSKTASGSVELEG